MRISKVILVFRKDWTDMKRNWQILLPIIAIPIIFSVFLPIVILIPSLNMMPTTSLSSLRGLMDKLPSYVVDKLAGMNDQQVLTYNIYGIFSSTIFPYNTSNGI